MESNTFSPSYLVTQDVHFKKYWKESQGLNIQDQVIEAYLAGVKKGLFQAEKLFIDNVSEMLQQSSTIIIPFIEEQRSKTGLQVKMKINKGIHLEFMFIFEDEDYFLSNKDMLYTKAIELEESMNDSSRTFLIRFISENENTDSEAIENDGFYYSFVGV